MLTIALGTYSQRARKQDPLTVSKSEIRTESFINGDCGEERARKCEIVEGNFHIFVLFIR